MNPFTTRIQAIQALAERSPGFVWRDVTDAEGVDFSEFIEDQGDMLINMTVWDNIENLFAFTYKTAHAKVMDNNRDNFKVLSKTHFVLWWVAEGHRPDGIEAREKLRHLRQHGPSPDAFTFRMPFSETGQPITPNFPKKDCA